MRRSQSAKSLAHPWSEFQLLQKTPPSFLHGKPRCGESRGAVCFFRLRHCDAFCRVIEYNCSADSTRKERRNL